MSILAKDNNITLKQHTEDLRRAFEDISSKISDENLKKCICYAILLHDIGKVLPYFQIRNLKNESYKPYEITVDIYHSLLSILFISQDSLKEKLNGDENSLRFVLSAIAYHHWKDKLEFLLRFGSETFEDFKEKLEDKIGNLVNNIHKEFSNDNKIKELIQFNYDMLDGLINGISFDNYIVPPYKLYWLPKRVELDEEGKKKWVLISGFLQRCDHFASYCEEAYCKEANESELKIDIDSITNDEIKQNIINTLKISENDLWQYKTLFQNKQNNDKQLYEKNLIFIAPTGSGKTEFAFLWSNGQKFFYTLPLRAAVEQIFDRAKKVFKDDKTGLLHSDADVYLIKDDNDLEKIKTYEVSKQLAYPVIVSTGDQFFPYGLRPPGYEKIYATFSYSRLVIDEVQAYDPKAAAIVVKFIEDISRLGGKFLLMTATLPRYIKDEIKDRLQVDTPELNLYEKEKNKYENLKKHKVNFIKISNSEKNFSIPDNIIEDIVRKAQNQRVLVILNTIKQAKSVYEKIIKKANNSSLCTENILLFHSQFTLNEKQRIKEEIENQFKNPKDQNDNKGNKGKILVATQVVEAAIDIDADVLYTEIAPMDALVQRMGRVLRRYKEGFSLDENAMPNVNILVFEKGYESGNGRVYDRELIEKTLIVFEKYNNLESLTLESIAKFKINDLQILKEKTNKRSKKNVDENDRKNSILISEYQKYQMVNKLYDLLNPEGKYLSDFYTTLDILDAGFMADRKEEAQKIFREIVNVSVVDDSNKEKFKEETITFINNANTNNNNNLNYTLFKKGIIAKFVINIPYYQFEKIKICKLGEWIEEMQINDSLKQKLLRWADDIWVVKINEDKNSGEDNII